MRLEDQVGPKSNERARRFSKERPASEKMRRLDIARFILKEWTGDLLPRADEVPHSPSYLTKFRYEYAPHETGKPWQIVRNHRARTKARFTNGAPIVIAGRRIHRVLIPFAFLGATLVIGAMRRLLLLLL